MLARPYRLSLDGFARAGGLHPDLVRRLVALDLLEATRDASGALWFAPSDLARLARLQRLRAGLALNYAALGVVCDLLDRIDALEAELRAARQRSQRSVGGRSGSTPWT
jgi:DNA-binding transcriptional MerR regulator